MLFRYTFIAASFLGCALSAQAQSPHTLDTSLAAPGTPVLVPRQGGSVFGEGVAADWDGNVYFNEMDNNNRTMRLQAGQDTAKPWRQANDAPNGMWLDTRNRIVICQAKAIVRVKALAVFDNQTDTLYKYPSDGSKFNDVTGDSKDNLYFTNFEGRTVYFRNAATGETRPVLSNVEKPNGIEWDEERKRVYVNVNGASKVVVYTVAGDFSLTNPVDFAAVPTSDGIVLDERGNVYAVAYNDRVHVFTPDGAKRGEIVLGNNLTNLAFGGADFKTLYMITQRGLYKLPMKVKGYKSGNYTVAIRPSAVFGSSARNRWKAAMPGNSRLWVRPADPAGVGIDARGRSVPLRPIVAGP